MSCLGIEQQRGRDGEESRVSWEDLRASAGTFVEGVIVAGWKSEM